jgi:hypothetical protein
MMITLFLEITDLYFTIAINKTIQGQAITGNWMNTMMTDTFDVETDFARQFDLQSFCQ